MKNILIMVMLISFTLEESLLKKSRRSKHGEDCVSDSACEEGFFCKLNRCMTSFEKKKIKDLGLQDKNLCDLKKLCPSDKKCVKHRCVNLTEIETPLNRTENETDVNLVFAGSIYLGQKAYKSGEKLNETFNYNHLFKNISKDIKSADLAIVAQDTVFHINPEEKIFPKRITNTPREIGDAIVNAGFKVVLHGSINAFNQKEKGIQNTIDFWKTKYPNITILGISKTQEDSQKDFYIYTKDNLKIGFLDFTTYSLKNSAFLINSINKKKIEECVGGLKKMADFVIVCINWGKRGDLKPDKNQIALAKSLAAYGADLIVGNGPIFVNPVSFIKAENGNKALVFWSLGLLVGDEKKEFSNIGALANVIISKGREKAYLSSYSLVPIINHKVNTVDYSVYKLEDYTEELGLKADKKFSFKKIKEKCKKLMGSFAHCG